MLMKHTAEASRQKECSFITAIFILVILTKKKWFIGWIKMLQQSAASMGNWKGGKINGLFQEANAVITRRPE